MRTIVILNAHAGAERQAHGDATPDALQAIFGPGTDVRTPAAKELSRELIAAVAARPETLIVGGGDGTISAAAGALVGTGITLGVLPLGTLNHFAKDLGLPLSWPEAAQALAGGTTREVCLAYQPEAGPGDFVLVHVGFAIAVIARDEAEKVWRVLEGLGETAEGGDPPASGERDPPASGDGGA